MKMMRAKERYKVNNVITIIRVNFMQRRTHFTFLNSFFPPSNYNRIQKMKTTMCFFLSKWNEKERSNCSSVSLFIHLLIHSSLNIIHPSTPQLFICIFILLQNKKKNICILKKIWTSIMKEWKKKVYENCSSYVQNYGSLASHSSPMQTTVMKHWRRQKQWFWWWYDNGNFFSLHYFFFNLLLQHFFMLLHFKVPSCSRISFKK